MTQLSIKIKIADREYPMKVELEEEERLRRAGRELNDRLRDFQRSFGIDDKQDLLAMIAFDTMVEKIKFEGSGNHVNKELEKKVELLNQLVKKAL